MIGGLNYHDEHVACACASLEFLSKLLECWSLQAVVECIAPIPVGPFRIVLVAQEVHPILFGDFPCCMPPPHLSLEVPPSLDSAIGHQNMTINILATYDLLHICLPL